MHYLAIYLFTHWLLFSSRSHRYCRWKASWSRCTRLVFNYIMLLVRKKTIIDNNFVVFSTENNYPYLYWVFRPIYFENEPLRPGYLTKPRIQLSPGGYSLIFVYEGRVFWIIQFGPQTGIDFAHFGLESGMVFEGILECMNVFVVSVPNN